MSIYYRNISYFFLCFLLVNFPLRGLAFEIGIGTHFQGYNKDVDFYLKLMKENGFTSFRDDYRWSRIEIEKGKYEVSDNIRRTDTAFYNAKKNGLNGLMILDYGNDNYNNGYFPNDPISIDAFAKYAEWTAKRFKGKVKYYEIWNEWTNATGMVKFRNNIPSAKVYFELVKKTSEAIKKVDPDAVILAGSFNPLEQRAKYIGVNDWVWFHSLAEMGILKYIDGVSIHSYSYLNRDKSLRTASGNLLYIDKFHKDLSASFGNFPIYITEVGITTYKGPGGMDEKAAAKFIEEYTSGAKKRDYIKGIWWYDLVDDGKNSNSREHNFGFYKNNMEPKLSVSSIKKSVY